MGFIQFLSPTFTFFTGYFIFREPFPVHNFIAYGLIWSAVIFYCFSFVRPKP
jgi:chloramphenicol-sensitive protein RarD